MAEELATRLLLGFVGATGSGKTTLASRLVEQRGFTRVHMGQPIKDMLAVLGLTPEQLTGTPEVRGDLPPSSAEGRRARRWRR